MKYNNFRYCPFCSNKINKISRSKVYCKKCSGEFYFYSKPTISVIPIYEKEILLVQRGTEPWKDLISTIGGFLEDGEDPINGAIREFKEETGIKVTKNRLFLLGFVRSDYPYRNLKYNLLNILYIMPVAEKMYPNPRDDVQKFIWCFFDKNSRSSLPYQITEFMEEVFKKIQKQRK